jgi:pyridoxamine 5'-phosphate oxidase
MDLKSVRKEYTLGSLDVNNTGDDPIHFFSRWMHEAVTAGINEPTAMTLSTLGSDGYPQARVVLLKSCDQHGFTFFTNYDSDKGFALRHHPRAALLFFWPELQRQVRISGMVTKVSRESTEHYFSTRPRGSQAGAWASDQSREIPSREFLEARFSETESRFAGTTIPAPAHWGGYQLDPVRIEFWQGRESRLHDRILFEKFENGWKKKRLAP